MEAKVLAVDLTSGKAWEEELPSRVQEEYLGGRALAARLMWPWARPPVHPFAPENKVIFSVGPLQGTGVSFDTKAVVSTISPLTGLYVYAVGGGQFGPALGRSGYLALVIQGQASSPVYLFIQDGKVEFRDAKHLWGIKAGEAQRAMVEELEEEEAATIVIGPAGESLVHYACPIAEGNKFRAFARGGAGAVMGAKRLKGLAIIGPQKKEIARPGEYLSAIRLMADTLRNNLSWVRDRAAHGTRGGLHVLNAVGILPTRNWWTGIFDKANVIDSYFRARSKGRGIPCGDYCVAPCSAVSVVEEGQWAGAWCEGPEYESIYALGSNCLLSDAEALVKACQACDDWGLDTMSTGLAISFAMECFEKGLITEKDTEGIDLTFGNAQALLKMIDMIALRQGLGDLLAQGTKVAAQKIGQGSDFFAMHGKGMEFGGYECRTSYGQAIQCAVSMRGGCHHDLGLPARVEMTQGTGMEIKGKGELVKRTALARTIYDSAVLCSFALAALGLEVPVRLLAAATGLELGMEEIKIIAERALNLERALHVRFGVRREDDRLPGRLLSEGYPQGPHKGAVVPLEELKNEFYSAMGWDLKTGIPSKDKLLALGLGDVAGELYPG